MVGAQRKLLLAQALSTRGTALHAAALNGNIGAVKLLLEHGADPASTKHSHGVTPLHLAAYNGHEAAVHTLLNAGAPAGARDKRGRPPSAWAKRRGHAELAACLTAVEQDQARGVHVAPCPPPSHEAVEDGSSAVK